MTTIAHISDVHFGREDPVLVEALVAALAAARPDVVVVSGDFTQRAKKRQFRAARAFLRRLPAVPRLYVPGNHDVSTTNLLERALHPLRRYQRYIEQDLSPYLDEGAVAIAGLSTVRLLKAKNGRINSLQVAKACRQLGRAAAGAVRVVVTHHPLDVPGVDEDRAAVARAPAAMAAFARCRVDLFLSGHLHGGLSLTTAMRYPESGYAAVVAHAGTAVSTRTREQPNSWNLIAVGGDAIEVGVMGWNGKRFKETLRTEYRRGAAGWGRTVGSG